MERLTKHGETTQRMCLNYGSKECNVFDCDECPYNGAVWDKLAEYEDAEEQGLRITLPCKVGSDVYVDVRTLPYNYLHPLDDCEYFAKCEVIGFTETRKGTYMKLSVLCPSRMHRRGYLRYPIGAIGKTVFLTKEAAEKALKESESNE